MKAGEGILPILPIRHKNQFFSIGNYGVLPSPPFTQTCFFS